MIPVDVSTGRRPDVISILCPSRRRPEMLTRSVASLRGHAIRPDLIEVLVAYDPDDPETKATAASIDADVIWEAPERYGHPGCAYYFAALLERSHGEWMCPWNDDAFMRTAGWDELVRSAEAEILHNEDNSGSGCFPFVHVGVFDIIGRFTSHPAIDTWYTDIGWGAGICKRIPILVHQERPDLGTADPDATWLEGRVAPVADYFRSPCTDWRNEDIAMLAARCAA